MYRDYEEYMRTVLGYNPVQEGINRGTYINPYNDLQFNNINPIFPKTTTPINNTETRFQPTVPLNITSARQQDNNIQNTTLVRQQTNNTKNTTSIKQQSDVIQNDTPSKQQGTVTKNVAPVKQQANMPQNTTTTNKQNVVQNRNIGEAARTQAINNNNKIPRQGNSIKSIEKNTPATSYKNFLKF